MINIHRVRSGISALGVFQGLENAAEAALGRVDEALPHLNRVRNSIAHLDERILGLKNGKKRINTQSPGIVVGNLSNEGYTTLCEDGAQHTVPIDEPTLFLIRDALQSVFDQLPLAVPGWLPSPSQ